jgi:sulfonate transport system permease protein
MPATRAAPEVLDRPPVAPPHDPVEAVPPAPSAAPAPVLSAAAGLAVRTVVRTGADDGPPRRSSRRLATTALRRLRGVRRLASLVALLVLWQVGSSRGWIAPQKLPPPSDVWAAFTDLVEGGELGEHLAASLGRMGRGLLLGGLLAVVMGTIAGLSRIGEEVVDAPLQALRVIPNLALASLFIIWFGIGEPSKVYLIALGAFFPLYLNVFGGIRNVDNRLVEAARVFGLGRVGLALRVMLPGALPQLLIGLRQSIGVAWLSLVVVEQTNARAGIGTLIIDAREFSRTDVVVVGLLVYAVLGLLTDLSVRLIEKGVLPWRASFSGI